MPIIKDIGELCLAKHKVEITGVNTSFLKSLPPKESAELLIAYHNGDKKAKENLILGNMKLVLSITNKFSNIMSY